MTKDLFPHLSSFSSEFKCEIICFDFGTFLQNTVVYLDNSITTSKGNVVVLKQADIIQFQDLFSSHRISFFYIFLFVILCGEEEKSWRVTCTYFLEIYDLDAIKIQETTTSFWPQSK